MGSQQMSNLCLMLPDKWRIIPTKFLRRLNIYLELLHIPFANLSSLLYPHSLWTFEKPNINNYKMQAYTDQIGNRLCECVLLMMGFEGNLSVCACICLLRHRNFLHILLIMVCLLELYVTRNSNYSRKTSYLNAKWNILSL